MIVVVYRVPSRRRALYANRRPGSVVRPHAILLYISGAGATTRCTQIRWLLLKRLIRLLLPTSLAVFSPQYSPGQQIGESSRRFVHGATISDISVRIADVVLGGVIHAAMKQIVGGDMARSFDRLRRSASILSGQTGSACNETNALSVETSITLSGALTLRRIFFSFFSLLCFTGALRTTPWRRLTLECSRT